MSDPLVGLEARRETSLGPGLGLEGRGRRKKR